jgi:hypothetical protein
MKLILIVLITFNLAYAQSTPSYTSSSIQTDSSYADTRDGRANYTSSYADTRDGRASYTSSYADTRDGRANYTSSYADTRDGRPNYTSSSADTTDGKPSFVSSSADTRDGVASYTSSRANMENSSIPSVGSYSNMHEMKTPEAKKILTRTNFASSQINTNKLYLPTGRVIAAENVNPNVIQKTKEALKKLSQTDEFKCSRFIVTTAVPASKGLKAAKRFTVVATTLQRTQEAAKIIKSATKIVKGVVKDEFSDVKACYSVIKN